MRDSVWPPSPGASRCRSSIGREPDVDAGGCFLDGRLVTLGSRCVPDDGLDSGIVDLESSDDAVSVRRCRDRHSAVEQQRRAERVDGVNNSVDDAGLNQLLGCESCDLPGHSVGRCGRAGHHDVTAHLDDSDPPRRRGSVGVRSDDQRIMRRESARCVRQVAPQGSDSISIGRQHSDEYVRNPSLDVSDLLRGTGRLERDGAVAGRERTQRRCGPGGSGSADARFGAVRFVSYRCGSPAPIRHRTSRGACALDRE